MSRPMRAFNVSRHCEERSDEAIQTASRLSQAALDCFASLAMTRRVYVAADA
jgi:hypothetical protein